MSSYLYQPGSSLAVREMLFVGSEESFDANIRDFPYQDDTYYFEVVNNCDTAFQWLEQRVSNLETYQLPYAVICSLDAARNDGFALANRLKTHSDLRYVPLIAFAESGDLPDKELMLRHGIDDFYTIPVPWKMLEARLDFLNQYKPKLLELAAQMSKEHYSYVFPTAKRIFDILGAGMGILLSVFIWLPVAVAIRLESRGPVLYSSKRVGAGYRIFNFLKFRSMYLDADQQLEAFQHLNRYDSPGERPVFVKFARDPRITRVGRFIRKYSIDELPQLINVLRGEMSLVGNRPLPLYEAELLTRDEWCMRFLAPAGITGLWQVTKRDHPAMSAAERIELDIAYAHGYTIWTDLTIILKTFRAVVQKEDF